VVGAAFPVVGTFLRVNGDLTWQAVAVVQRDPVFWLLDLMPAVTTVIGLVVGAMRDSLSLTTAMLAAAHNDVRVATRALEETTVQATQRDAELARAQNDLDRFAQVAAHDLQAPLHAINSLADWVRADLGQHLSNAGHEHLRLLQVRAHRMEALLNSLRAYTMAGREREDIEAIDVRVLAHQVLRQVPGGSRFIMSFEGSDTPLHTSR